MLSLPGFRKVKYEANPFFLKYHLNGPWFEEKVVLYLEQAEPEGADASRAFPLLDLLVANKALKLDNVSELMDQFGLQKNQKNLVKRFKKELQKPAIQELLADILKPDVFEETLLIQGLWCSALKLNRVEDWDLIFARLLRIAQPDQSEEWNRVSKKTAELGLFPSLQKRIEIYFNLKLEQFTKDALMACLAQVFYNLMVREFSELSKEDTYSSLKLNHTDQARLVHWQKN